MKAIKAAGLFSLHRAMAWRGFSILCYHGFSVRDEHAFRPGMFMRPETFARRLELLAETGSPVIRLAEALSPSRPANAVVITIDDGWSGTLQAAQELHRRGMSATVYLSTYYVETQTQVFNVLVDYLLWKAAPHSVSIPEWNLIWDEESAPVTQLRSSVKAMGVRLPALERQALADALSDHLGVDTTGMFRYVSREEVGLLRDLGMDIQLHTHRHRFDALTASEQRREIEENRAAIHRLTGGSPTHFCYPSGKYDLESRRVLEELGIQTATTCSNHVNLDNTDRYQLGRFLDSEDFPEVVFQAEAIGLLGRIRSLVGVSVGPT